MQISPKSNKIIKIAGLVLASLVISVGVGIRYVWVNELKPYMERLERPRVPLLKKVAAAQTIFRDQDLDKDRVTDFANLEEFVKAKLLTERSSESGISIY